MLEYRLAQKLTRTVTVSDETFTLFPSVTEKTTSVPEVTLKSQFELKAVPEYDQ